MGSEQEANADPSATTTSAAADARAEIGVSGGTATAAAQALRAREHNFRFICLDNAIYHEMREHFFSRVSKTLVGLQVLFSTSAFGAIFADVGGDAGPIIAAFGALAGTVLLVADPATLAREHRTLRSRYYGLLSRLPHDHCTDEILSEGWKGLMDIASEEFPTYRALRAISYNTVVDTLYPATAERPKHLPVSRIQQVLAQWWPYHGVDFTGGDNAETDHDGVANTVGRSPD